MIHPDLYPGGTFAISRTGSEVGCWIRPGDILLFDVVQKVMDGSYHAMPTKFVQRRSHSEKEEEEEESIIIQETTKNKPCIRLIETTLCGRTQGIVQSIHDNNYGFIQLAERNAVAYFPLFEVFPSEMQGYLVRNNPSSMYQSGDADNVIQNNEGGGGRVNIEVGMEVEFDLSLQSVSGGGSGGGSRYHHRQNNRGPIQEKESIRGRRIQILPKGSVKDKILVAPGVKATVTRSDPRQPFIGTLELEESHVETTGKVRHPLVVRLLEDILGGRYGCDEVVFHDTLSEKDEQIVTNMIQKSARDGLEFSYVPKDAPKDSPRKLCIKVRKKSERGGGAELDDKPVTSDDNVDEARAEKEGAEETLAVEEQVGKVQKNKKNKTAKKSIRYDKLSFHDMSLSPLRIGDIVACDVFQLRRNGAFQVEISAVVERKEIPLVVSDCKAKLSGFVSDVVPSRQFGFITAVNEDGSKTSHIFFHFKEFDTSTSEDASHDGNTRGKKSGRSSDVIKKGAEVKFEAAPGKNGKLNATNIELLPPGTLKIPSKSNDSSSTCTGYILIEPSHTALAISPTHTVTQSGPAAKAAGGRWANVRDDHKSGSTNIKEGGIILLLTDPSNLFSPSKPKAKSLTKANKTDEKKDIVVETSTESKDESTGADNGETDVVKSESKDATDDQSRQSAVGTHVRYKLSSLAARGFSNGRSDPKRGDLVTFSKTKGASLVKDIRVEKVAAATTLRGTLIDINIDQDIAVLVPSDDTDENKRYGISLTEVVSCDKTLLKNQEQVDGILHEGRVFGVCRTKDIYLASSFGGSSGGLKERPRLNLTVKKELGGQVMAQSKMAKGPDGTNGFTSGWTTRVSFYSEEELLQDSSLSIAAAEFVPTFEIATSGFASLAEAGGNANE